MDTQFAIALVGIVVALISVIYAALQWEIRKLRRQGHMHANRLTEHGLALSMILQKVGIDFKPRGGRDDE